MSMTVGNFCSKKTLPFLLKQFFYFRHHLGALSVDDEKLHKVVSPVKTKGRWHDLDFTESRPQWEIWNVTADLLHVLKTEEKY